MSPAGSANRRLWELLTDRRGVSLLWELEIDWTLQATARYRRADQTADETNRLFSWLVDIGGGAEALQLTPQGSTQTISDLTIRLAREFERHCSIEEPAGRWAHVYALLPGDGSRVLVWSGVLLDPPANSYDPNTGIYTLSLMSPLALIQSRPVPAYVLNPTDAPNAPQDALGQPLPLLFGTVGPVFPPLISDWPESVLSQRLGATADVINIESVAGWPEPDNSGMMSDCAATDGALRLSTTDTDWPADGLITPVGSPTEVIGWGSYTQGVNYIDIDPAFRGYGGTTRGAWTSSDPFIELYLAVIDEETENAEWIAYGGIAASALIACVRGLFNGGVGRTHEDGATIRCLRGVSLASIVNGKAIAALDADSLRTRDPDTDRLTRVHFPVTTDASDLVTVPGQTVASIIAQAIYHTEEHIGFESAVREVHDYGSGSDLPITSGYAILPLDSTQDESGGQWADLANGHDDDTGTYAVGTQFFNYTDYAAARWRFSPGAIPLATWAEVDHVYVYIRVRRGQNYHENVISLTLDAAGIWSAELTEGELTDDVWQYWDVSDLADWTIAHVDADVRIILPPGFGNPQAMRVYEIGLIVTIPSIWGWFNSENAIDGDDATFALWASVNAGQVDLLSLAAPGVSDGINISAAQIEIEHEETGVAGDWAARYARIRCGETSDTVGAWVAIPLRAAKTLERVTLPLPSSGLSGTPIVELATSATMGITMNVYRTHIILWVDHTTEDDLGDQARELVMTEVDGTADDAGGTYTGTPYAMLEQPADIEHYLIRELGGIGAGYIDEASFVADRVYSAGLGLVLAGAMSEQEPLGGILGAIGQNGGNVPLWRDGQMRCWRWPQSASAVEWQFVRSRQGPRNVLDTPAVRYARTAAEQLVSGLTLQYSARPYSSARSAVRGAASRRPPMGGGAGVHARYRWRLAYPHLLEWQHDPEVEAWTWRRFSFATDLQLQMDWINDITAAGLIGAHIINVFGRRRWIVIFGAGPEGMLVKLGSLGEWIDEDLPWPILQGFRRERWWDGLVYNEDLWPLALRGFYGVCIAKRRVSDNAWELTVLEWCAADCPALA